MPAAGRDLTREPASRETRRRALLVLLAALLGTALTARLGWWQLDRAAQKLAFAHGLEERGRLPALTIGELARDPATAESQRWRHVVLQGRWLPERTVYLDNRPMEGQPGFFVMTPLLVAPGDAVLVQRGWLPRSAGNRETLPRLDTPAGEVEVRGLIAPPPSKLLEFEHQASGAIRQNLDLADVARETGMQVRPLSVWQQGDDVGLLRRHWSLPSPDVAMHYGYALQWFGLAALIAGLYVWFRLLRPRLGRHAR